MKPHSYLSFASSLDIRAALMAIILIIIPARVCAQTSATATRGIGKYPGAPAEFFGPKVTTHQGAARNLALHRTAWASSTVDYNQTAHLVTDGIVGNADKMGFLTASTPAGNLPRREAEWAIDGGPYSSNVLMGPHTWIQYDWGGALPFTAAAVRLDGRVAYDDQQATRGYRIAVQTSADGQTWQTIGELKGADLPGTPMQYKLHSDPNKQTSNDFLPARVLGQTINFDKTPAANGNEQSEPTCFRLMLDMDGAAYWDLHRLHFLDANGKEIWMQPSQKFTSAWVSNGGGKQWLLVDLGAPATIERITPHWAQEPVKWHTETTGEGRFVTIVMEEPNASGYYALNELEVWGTGGVDFEPHAQAPRSDANRLCLSGGRWQLQRASEVSAAGEAIASDGFDTNGWIWATVPGTVLTSYINIGAVPDPNYADWVDQISESFFRSNFWYRDEFEVDGELLRSGALQRLHFDGINWKANVFLNGRRLGRIEGAFMHGDFDVTGVLVEGKNVLAVEIIANEHFGSVKEKDENTTQFNGGILGADNPTFHASIGWDWITTVRGRNAGIWNEVYVTSTSKVTLSDPYLRTQIDNKKTKVTPSVFVRNHADHAVSGTLTGWIGDVRFNKTVDIPAASEQEITFSPSDFPQLSRSDFRLWWPNGYGEPYRYAAGFEWKASDASATERLNFRAGLREMTYEHVADSLLMYVNGRRFVPLGGNWGFDEHNLRYRSREYMTAVAYHRDMHCTMIRDWVGMIGDEAFYDACDSLGMMIWQDFWLANPADGPDPYNDALFLKNARDYVRRIRHYAAIGLFCGRNEGFPPESLDTKLRAFVKELTPGLVYIPSSADETVTGHGPYCAQPARVYFERQSGKIHTERGMPAVMNIESLKRTFTDEALWPQSRQWGQHDYTLRGAQRAQEFNDLVAKTFGESESAEQFARRAQLINYDGYRSMFESTSCKRAGLLIWMSHPCWPSMVWQTYDYYFEPTAAYFGVKKACEPLHIQHNVLTDSIEVVNLFAGNQRKLTATATIYDQTGRPTWTKKARLNSGDDTTTPVIHVDSMLLKSGGVLRLQLSEGRNVVSVNDYLLGRTGGSQSAIASLPAPSLQQSMTTSADGDLLRAEVTVKNTGSTLAPLIRLNLKGADGEQILPATYSDNYFNLLPGEQRTISISWRSQDARGQQPQVEVKSLASK